MEKVREGSSGIQYFMSKCVFENDFYFYFNIETKYICFIIWLGDI